MGRASRKRQQWRINHLVALRAGDPDTFSAEWGKRIESWAHEANRLARLLVEDDGSPAGRAHDVVEKAMRELEEVGEEAVAMEGQATRETLDEAGSIAIAAAVDTRLYPGVARRYVRMRVECY